MSFLGNAVKALTRGSEAKAFGFLADLAWQMLKAQKTKLPGSEKRDMVLRWFEGVFSGTFGPKYEELRKAVVELITVGKHVVGLIKALG
jgi:hypothetical protein